MTLPSSGPISFNDVATELGVSTADFSISSEAARTLAGVASGPISMSDFYGKSQLVATLVGGSFDRTSPGETGAVAIIMSPGNGYLTVEGSEPVVSTQIDVISGPRPAVIVGQDTQWPQITMTALLDAGPETWRLQIEVNYAGGIVLSNEADFTINFHS